MKACILVRGIHYDNKYNNGNHPPYIGQDFRKSITNFNEYILKPLQKSYKQVDIITATYDSELYSQMVSVYKPIKQIVIPFTNKRNQLIVHGLQAIKESNVHYDLILIYRFDIILKQKITDLNYNIQKFNIPFKDLQGTEGLWPIHHRICDGFFIFNGSLLEGTIKAFEEKFMDSKTHQHTFNHLCKHLSNESIHFIIDKELRCNNGISDNPLYRNRL